jgi:DnaJ-class molecular chaperone
MAVRDLYQELGVAKGADHEAIRKAFRKKAKDLHPDRNPGDKKAEEQFKRLSGAFDILGDPDKRAKYDRGEIDADGHERVRGFPGGGAGAGGYQSGPFGGFGQRGFEGGDFDDFLSQVFGQRREAEARQAGAGPGGFNGFSGGFSSGKGADVRAKLEIDLEEAIAGARKRIAFSDGRTLDVTIPAGAQDGQTLRLKGQGAPGAKTPGDALIELTVKPHPVFKREGPGDADLTMELPVTVYDAVLGGKVQAPTPDGPVTLTVPKHSSSGRTLKLRGKGGTAAGGGRGDLYARLVVALPEGDAELERFAERWKAERPYEPRRR